ncbi:MAG: hypothetical protein N3D84_03350, partial [Candidatus Woesearchaeota archaeon]|nr:hypothetical protein [Candidatus Woesearchaeota archaeon]
GYTGAANLERPIGAARDEPILSTAEIGQTVTEGRAGGGSFIESVQAAIRKGVASVELAAMPAGAEPGTGVESYGVQKRRELREIARANEVKVVSVHTPTQVGNLSGFAGPERGFIDEQREAFLNEVKKAINFAADVTQGGAVVVHTGEFHRPISEQPWARDEYGRLIFKHYEEEPERAVLRLVDERTGHIITQVRKNQEVFRPIWLTADRDYDYVDEKTGEVVHVKKGDYIDYENRKVDIEHRIPAFDPEAGRFKVQMMKWEDFVKEAEERNRYKEQELGRPLKPEEKITPEEAFLRATIENQAAQAKGWALYHIRQFNQKVKDIEKLKEALKYYKKLEESVPEEERWKLMKPGTTTAYHIANLGLVPREDKLPSQLIEEELAELRHDLEHTYQGSVSYEQQAEEQYNLLRHVKPVERYALEKSTESYAEAGIYAMDQTNARKLKNPIFIAPEQVFPEMGYGSHPDELIELVQKSREKMAERLVKERGFDPEQAKMYAEKHIKATLDTEHLGLWKRYFQRKPGESEEEFEKRFNSWYMDQIKKMEKAGIIGHIHIADGFGYGHANLPAGHGSMPVVDAITYLKKKGYTGAYLSEGYGDVTRMLRETWQAFGSHIYSKLGPIRPGAPQRWSDIEFSYFGRGQTPYYIFGPYAPSNDWTLWTGVPLE